MNKEIIDESKYLRVTTPLQRYNGYESVPANILEYAADRGTRVHTYCELYTQNMIFGEVDADCIPYVQAFINFYDTNIKFAVAVEKRLFCSEYFIQGKPDLVASIKKKEHAQGHWLIDIKTSLNYSKTWDLQTAAYAHLCKINNLPIAGRLVLQVKKDGSYEEIYYDDFENNALYIEHFKIYKGILRAHRFFEKRKTEKDEESGN